MSGARGLRLLSRVEGISLLALVFVAVPLKYALEMPMAVRIAGTLHGVLFLGLLVAGLHAWIERALPRDSVLRVLGWSVVPFGFLLVERGLSSGLGASAAPREDREDREPRPSVRQ